MVLRLKKSRITNWWIACRDDKMNFFNILSSDHLIGDLVVMGYFDNTKELAHSTNSVSRITKNGIITSQGTFYPFEEAHPLYLKFLLKANTPNTVVASYWKVINFTNLTMVANLLTTDGLIKDVTFDFIPINESPVMFFGHSNDLNADVVISTFRRKGYCSTIRIPKDVKSDIYNTSIILKDDFIKLLKKVKRLYKQKSNKTYISVTLP